MVQVKTFPECKIKKNTQVLTYKKMSSSIIDGISVDQLLTYLEQENKRTGMRMGYKLPTQIDHPHHSRIELLCGTCGHELGLSSEASSSSVTQVRMKQMDRNFISISIPFDHPFDTVEPFIPLLEFKNLKMMLNMNGKDLILECKNCGSQLGSAALPSHHHKPKTKIEVDVQNHHHDKKEHSITTVLNGKLFWKDIYRYQQGEALNPLILLPKNLNLSLVPFSTNQSVKASQQASREPNEIRFKKIIQRHVEEEERLRQAAIVTSQENSTTIEKYQAYLRDGEMVKRKMFKRLHNLKMSDQDLENDDMWKKWLFWYRDKNIPALYDKFNQLLRDEFHGNIRGVRKIEEVIKGHLLEDFQLHTSVLKLKQLVESDDANDKFELRSILHRRIFNEELLPSSSFEVLPYSSSVCEEHYKEKFFCFIDLTKANFSTLRTFDPDIFGGDHNITWRQFLNKETTFELFHSFQYTIRHPVFGKLNHGFSTRKMIEIAEHEQLNILYNMMKKHLLKEHPHLFEESHLFVPPIQCASDAFFFCFNTLQDAKVVFDALCRFDTELFPNVKDLIHLTVFKNHYYYFTNEEINSESNYCGNNHFDIYFDNQFNDNQFNNNNNNGPQKKMVCGQRNFTFTRGV